MFKHFWTAQGHDDESSTVNGIEEILAQDGNAVPVAYYDVMGRLLDGPRPGINIVKMSNGTAKKVLVK